MTEKEKQDLREGIHEYLDNSQLEFNSIGLDFQEDASRPKLTIEAYVGEVNEDLLALPTEVLLDGFRNISYQEIKERLADTIVEGLSANQEQSSEEEENLGRS